MIFCWYGGKSGVGLSSLGFSGFNSVLVGRLPASLHVRPPLLGLDATLLRRQRGPGRPTGLRRVKCDEDHVPELVQAVLDVLALVPSPRRSDQELTLAGQAVGDVQ